MAHFSFTVMSAHQNLQSSHIKPAFRSLILTGGNLLTTTQFVNHDRSGGPITARAEVMKYSELTKEQQNTIGSGFIEFTDRFEHEGKMVDAYIQAYLYIDDQAYDYLWEVTKLGLVKGAIISLDIHPLHLGTNWDVTAKEYERIPLTSVSVSRAIQ